MSENEYLCGICNNNLVVARCPPLGSGKREIVVAYNEVVKLTGCEHFAPVPVKVTKLETLCAVKTRELKELFENFGD